MKRYIPTRYSKTSKNEVLEYLKNIDLGVEGKDYTLEQFFDEYNQYKNQMEQKFKDLSLKFNVELTRRDEIHKKQIELILNKLNLANEAILELNKKLNEQGEILS